MVGVRLGFSDFDKVRLVCVNIYGQRPLIRLKTEDDAEFAITTEPLFIVVRNVFVKAKAIIKAQQTKHRQEYPHANTGRPLEVEGVVIFTANPGIPALQEGEQKDG